MAEVEYRRVTADDLTAEAMEVEIYCHGTGEWQAGLTARVATMSGGDQVIVTGFANGAGGGMVYPKSHGILARVVAEEAETPPCVRCGVAPWGFGYCSELCEKCAADDEAEDARLAEEHQTASAANVW